jgi:hypothetical protein
MKLITVEEVMTAAVRQIEDGRAALSQQRS